ncbi:MULTISPECIES: hypothetical protein [unclassified Streptomyces]|uniref:hypothetical protein n=1 Tax=unclassified Streptomyces TaxID=2593676 RepID=UPI00344C5B42
MTDANTRWKARVRLALAERSVGGTVADEVLDEVDQHCAQSGERPEDAFGTPEEYAAAVVRDRLPPERRTGGHGPTRADHVSGLLGLAGLVALLGGGWAWVRIATMLTISSASLAGSALTCVAMTTSWLTVSLARTRRRGARRWGAVTAAAVLLAATAFMTLPRTSLGRVPAPALCVLGVLLLWAALRADRAPEPTPDPNPDREESAMTSQTLPENWLVDLPRLLQERHGLSRAQAHGLTREAAQHLTATGRDPEDEFGPVELYALKLAEEQAAPRPPWWQRNDMQAALMALILLGYLAVNLASHGPLWQTVLAAVALAVDLALLAGQLLRRPSRMPRR